MQSLTILLSGVLFALGLLLSGMNDPQRVLGFLDVAGRWDPALAFTMGGAILVAAPGYAFLRRRGDPLVDADAPPTPRIDRRLLAGSALFGIGWGLSGLCPGPALLLATGLGPQALAFVAAMAAGMLIVRIR